MKWNSIDGFREYEIAKDGLNSKLGIREIPHIDRCELIPYITYIYRYLHTSLVDLGPNSDLKTRIVKILDINTTGLDLIISHATLNLARRIGISSSTDYIEDEEIPYDQERLVYCWGHVLTTIIYMLRLQYPQYFLPPKDEPGDCHCKKCHGQDTADYESWTSGVYPVEEAVETDLGILTKPWRVVTKYPGCTKCQRKQSYDTTTQNSPTKEERENNNTGDISEGSTIRGKH